MTRLCSRNPFPLRRADQNRVLLSSPSRKSGAILLGFPDTTQDADLLFVDRAPANRCALAAALIELGFALTPDQATDIERGKDFVQLKNGPFDLDLVFAPDGIEHFDAAWMRRIEVGGSPCVTSMTSSPARRQTA